MKERTTFVAICAAVLLLAALDAMWMGWSDLPCPRGVDDAFYKSPAAELALNGKLIQPCAIDYLPRAGEVFGAYPPLYQIVVAAWFRCFGVSTGSSVAFGHFIHLLNMALVMAVAAAALMAESLPTSLRALAVSAAGLVYFGMMRFFDRQEELAALFCFLDMALYLRGQRRGLAQAGLTGALLGLSAIVSPWTGAVYAGIIALREMMSWRREERPLGIVAAQTGVILIVGAIPMLVWIGWLESTSPGAFRGVFGYHLRISEHTTIWAAPARAVASLAYSPTTMPAILSTLAMFPTLVFGKARAVPGGVVALFGGAAAALLVALVLRTNSYNYIWLCLFLLLPCFGYLAGRLIADAPPGQRFFPALMVVFCSMVALRDPLSLSLIAHDLPDAERPGPIFERLATQVPAGETVRVATTSRHWYFFQGRNPWRVTAIYPHLSEQQRREWVDWIVLPILPEEEASEQERAERRELTKGFVRVDTVPSAYETWAPSFFREDRTWAYELYRREP